MKLLATNDLAGISGGRPKRDAVRWGVPGQLVIPVTGRLGGSSTRACVAKSREVAEKPAAEPANGCAGVDVLGGSERCAVCWSPTKDQTNRPLPPEAFALPFAITSSLAGPVLAQSSAESVEFPTRLDSPLSCVV